MLFETQQTLFLCDDDGDDSHDEDGVVTMMKEKRLIRVIFSRTPETLVHNDDDCDDGDNLRMVMMTMEKRRKWRKL